VRVTKSTPVTVGARHVSLKGKMWSRHRGPRQEALFTEARDATFAKAPQAKPLTLLPSARTYTTYHRTHCSREDVVLRKL